MKRASWRRCTPGIRTWAPDIAALALHALAEVMEKARVARLTRYQHILLRLGELIAYAECAGSLARRAALAAEGKLHEKANQRFDATALAALARVFARDAALKVADDGLRLVIGAGGVSDSRDAGIRNKFGTCPRSTARKRAWLPTWITSPTFFTTAWRKPRVCPLRSK